MDKLTELLTQGIIETVGSELGVADHECMLAYETVEETAHEAAKLIAEMLKPLLAEVWEEGSDSTTLDYKDYGDILVYATNPYTTKETN